MSNNRSKTNTAKKRRIQSTLKPPAAGEVDAREQLYNGGEIGVITEVQRSEAEITSLRGIMLDLDPKLLRISVVSLEVRKNPKEFYDQIVSKWLARHPTLKKAEIRNSGTGLHAILRFDQPVEFSAEGERALWSAMVTAIQKILPTDPDCPGITALTRPVGSINSKNNCTVRRLFKGETITVTELSTLFDQIRERPFQTTAEILFGENRIAPCPICKVEASRLDVLSHRGRCYGNCGNVDRGQLLDVFFKARPKQER